MDLIRGIAYLGLGYLFIQNGLSILIEQVSDRPCCREYAIMLPLSDDEVSQKDKIE